MKDIAKEIEILRQMAVPELVVRYRELFGREPRVKHREHLWKRCAWKSASPIGMSGWSSIDSSARQTAAVNAIANRAVLRNGCRRAAAAIIVKAAVARPIHAVARATTDG